jgi:hypothetical protein
MMEWFKLSSKLPRDPKWKQLSPKAKVAYIEWACEIAEHETDGEYTAGAKPPRYVAEFLETGLAEDLGRGRFYLPAFLKWNKTHAEMEAEREKARERGRRSGKLRAKVGRTHATSSATEVEVEVEKGTTTQSAAKKTPRTPRQRNALVDVLAEVEGSTPTELTRPHARALGVAVASIREVAPDVSADEIRRRAANYSRQHPDWELTGPALAKHWAECGGLATVAGPWSTKLGGTA